MKNDFAAVPGTENSGTVPENCFWVKTGLLSFWSRTTISMVVGFSSLSPLGDSANAFSCTHKQKQDMFHSFALKSWDHSSTCPLRALDMWSQPTRPVRRKNASRPDVSLRTPIKALKPWLLDVLDTMICEAEMLTRAHSACSSAWTYGEAAELLPVQRLLAPDHAAFIVDLKQVLGLLVHPRPLQLVDHLAREDFVWLDLSRETRKRRRKDEVEALSLLLRLQLTAKIKF